MACMYLWTSTLFPLNSCLCDFPISYSVHGMYFCKNQNPKCNIQEFLKHLQHKLLSLDAISLLSESSNTLFSLWITNIIDDIAIKNWIYYDNMVLIYVYKSIYDILMINSSIYFKGQVFHTCMCAYTLISFKKI